MGHRKWATLIDDHDSVVLTALRRHRGREVKRTGDGFLAVFDAATRAVRAANEIVEGTERLGLSVRAGVHTGEVEFQSDDVIGLAVSIGKRICDLAGPGQVLVTGSVKAALVGSGVAFRAQGTHTLKGPDEWPLFAIEG